MKRILFALAALSALSVFGAVSESGPPRIVVTPSGTGAGNTGELRFKELVANGNHHTGFKAADSLAASVIYTLPPADGTNTYVLSTNGSGILSWVANGLGSVSSVALSMPAEFSVSGSPITTSGTFTVSKANQSANTHFAGPTSGGAAAPAFRALVEADIGANTVNTAAIKDANVTLAKIENIATDRLLGRDTASGGVTEQLTVGGGIEFTGSGGIQRSALTGDVTATAGSNSTAIASNAVVTAKIADANVTGAKLESRVRPNYNYLINGDFAIDQRKQASSVIDDVYCLDRWNYLMSGSFASRMYQGTANPDTGSKYYGACTHTVASARFAIQQIIEGKNMWHLRGKDVILQARVRTTEASKDVRACVISWTGTEDSVTSDVVNTWTSTTYTINNFFINNASLATISVSSAVTPGTTWTDISVTHTVNASATNLIVLFICNASTVSANEEFQVSKAGLYEGSELRTWMPRHIGEEIVLCQRYCWTFDPSSSGYYVGPLGYKDGNSLYHFYRCPQKMRAVPVMFHNITGYVATAPGTTTVAAYGPAAAVYRTLTGALTVGHVGTSVDSGYYYFAAGTSWSGTNGEMNQMLFGPSVILGFESEL